MWALNIAVDILPLSLCLACDYVCCFKKVKTFFFFFFSNFFSSVYYLARMTKSFLCLAARKTCQTQGLLWAPPALVLPTSVTWIAPPACRCGSARRISRARPSCRQPSRTLSKESSSPELTKLVTVVWRNPWFMVRSCLWCVIFFSNANLQRAVQFILIQVAFSFVSLAQGCKSFRFSLISDFFIKSNFKGARANLKTTF